ncbi:MAG TPA: hypothetical protein VIF02_10080 [Methylocella sp.]
MDETRVSFNPKSTEEKVLQFVNILENAARFALSSNAMPVPADDRKMVERSLRKLRPAFDELEKIVEPLRACDPDGVNNGFEAIYQLMSASFAIGVAGAFMKSAKNLFKKERAREHGKKSGEQRRKDAEITWRPHALELAKRIQAEKPNISQLDLAAEIANRWRLKIPCPKSQLVNAISGWQKVRALARPSRLRTSSSYCAN